MTLRTEYPALHLGDVVEFRDHHTSTPELGNELYLLELSRATGVTDPWELERMQKENRVPGDIDEKIKTVLSGRKTFRFRFAGKLELPPSAPSAKTAKYGVKEYLANVKFQIPPVIRLKPKHIGAQHVYVGTDRESKAFSGAVAGIYGSPGAEFTYFTNDWQLALSHSGEKPVLLEVEVKRLAKTRQIFPDPESTRIAAEKGKTFVVMGGIPLNAMVAGYNFERI